MVPMLAIGLGVAEALTAPLRLVRPCTPWSQRQGAVDTRGMVVGNPEPLARGRYSSPMGVEIPCPLLLAA